MEKRIKFEKGKQQEFIFKACQQDSLKKFLSKNYLGVPYSTLKKYARETLTLPLSLAEKIAKISNQKIADYKTETINGNWGAVKGGKKGIISLYKKYPDKISEWRKISYPQIKKYAVSKKIKEDIPLDEKLAEFIGVYLGDGTFTEYFIRIFGDKRYDNHYFNYIAKLIKQISGISPKIRTSNKNLLILEIASKKFCDFLKNNFALRYGSKIKNHQMIPPAILSKKSLITACLRGLIDTDGTVSKDGATLCIRFSSHNPLIIKQLTKINEKLNIFTFQDEKNMGTRRAKNIDKFFTEVGSSNLSRIIRYCEFKKGNLIKKEEVLNYLDEYRSVKLPYGLVV